MGPCPGSIQQLFFVYPKASHNPPRMGPYRAESVVMQVGKWGVSAWIFSALPPTRDTNLGDGFGSGLLPVRAATLPPLHDMVKDCLVFR